MSSIDVKKRVRDLLQGTYAVNGYYGLPDLIANTDDIVDEIYSDAGYSSTDLTNIKAWYAGRGTFPVFNEFPRLVKDLPAFFVFRASDMEMDRGSVGDFLYTDTSLDTDTTATEVHGSIFDEQIAIHLWAVEASQRDDLYIALRELIIRARLWFSSVDVMVEWKNGRDGQLYDPSAEPQIIHRAESTLFCKGSVQWSYTGEKTLDVVSREKDPITGIGEVEAEEYSDDQ
jgi:hypothetical protein